MFWKRHCMCLLHASVLVSTATVFVVLACNKQLAVYKYVSSHSRFLGSFSWLLVCPTWPERPALCITAVLGYSRQSHAARFGFSQPPSTPLACMPQYQACHNGLGDNRNHTGVLCAVLVGHCSLCLAIGVCARQGVLQDFSPTAERVTSLPEAGNSRAVGCSLQALCMSQQRC